MLTVVKELPFLKLGDFTLQFELGPLSPELQEVARKELRETPELQKESMERLKELLKAETDLKCPLDNDAWLIRFLRPCKYYPESAAELVKNYYKFKIKHSFIYNDLKPSKETNIFQQNILTVLPTRDQHGRRVLIIQLGKKWKHNQCSLDEIYKGCVLYLEAAMLEPATQVAGAIVIFDMDGLSLPQTWQFTPPFAKRLVELLQDAMPLRVKNLHIINQPYIFNMVFALFKPFLREKLKSRIIFHGTDRKSLHQYIAPSCLPECYGGTLQIPLVNGNQWLELLMMCDKEFEAINSYGYKK
ncbi:alpha-tocopherol transfer protein-like isoform X2 [Polistes fuscatus]|nr:alpha-tocopherol transfer protein-like isoform X2 [Polistes fuscatus]XP_043491341.1 alpha-tocopherol transfer protein-like isoform X2 [Polistes fuscatus]XP_043491342.1 alpha-tocopherol transfer protein-like isoform X2 [Polistes fuscatus]XP_043491343.1 alpha-tocopherol transfer protein-like isoform X2 [Polistes fuscatus]